jgi:hypothetical protein
LFTSNQHDIIITIIINTQQLKRCSQKYHKEEANNSCPPCDKEAIKTPTLLQSSDSYQAVT